VALIDRVKERFSTKRIIEITNPESTLGTVDDTFLANLCADVIAYLDGMSVGSYDETEPRWVALACDGVVALGQVRIAPGSDANRAQWDRWNESAREFAQTLRRDRLMPGIAQPERPSRFDAKTWRSMVPGRPRPRRGGRGS
jgi:hypothetical protein